MLAMLLRAAEENSKLLFDGKAIKEDFEFLPYQSMSNYLTVPVHSNITVNIYNKDTQPNQHNTLIRYGRKNQLNISMKKAIE
jgi:hypothetical protein